jgi:predicted alpha/beta hydrolase family esterase
MPSNREKPTEITADSLFSDLIEHFENQAYDEALACATLGAGQFPDRMPTFTYYRMCAAARLNDMALLRQIVDNALAQGLWYSEHVLRISPSFQPLQGQPAFEKLVQANVERRAEQSISEEKPPPLIFTPAQPPPYPTLFVVHGNNSSAQEEAASWQPAVEQGWLLGMPESSQVIWHGRYVWDNYDIAKRDILNDYATICAKYAVDNNIVVGGFSLGAQTVLRMLLEGALPGQGFVFNAPYIPSLEEWEARIAAATVPEGLRGYIVANEEDPTCTVDSIQTLVKKLEAHGVVCKLETIAEPGHFYPDDFAAHLARGLDFITGA